MVFLLSIRIFIFLPCICFAQSDPYHPLRITELIALDGQFNEAAWQLTPVIDDFMQTDPTPGAMPTERTEVRIMYDDEYLYVGFKCFDSDPSKLIRIRLERDFNLGDDDGTAITIDTYNDKLTGICFAANTLSARWDGQVLNDGNDLDDSFNTFWDAITSVDSSGYSTEYRIPFSSLRFESRPMMTMGFRLARLVRRKSELITHPRCDPSTANAWDNISFAREIVFEDLRSRKPFYLIPYVIANYSVQNVLNQNGDAYEKQTEFLVRKNYVSNKTFDKILSNIGADAKYGLSKNFTLDLTLNTDFAQAEVDDIVINLTKYAVNLPEKRGFFLESAHYLSFSFASGNEMFVSRNIGNENGVIVPIIAGARVTGKTRGWQMGMLDMQTKGITEDSIAPHNFFVFRTRKDIDKLGSFAGGIFTNRLNTDSTHSSNQTIGLGMLKRLNQHLSLLGGVTGTLINADVKGLGNSMFYNVGIANNKTEGFIYSGFAEVVGKNFNPVMGYLDETNHGLLSGDVSYQWLAGKESKVQYWYFFSDNSYRWILSSGKRETFSTDLWPGLLFKNGAFIEASLFSYTIDSLSYQWYLDDENAIAPGTYKMFTNYLNMHAPENSNYAANLFLSYGGFYGGQRLSISPDAAYSFNKHLSVGIAYEYNRIPFTKYLEIDSVTLYQSNLFRLRVSYIISTKVALKLYMQIDNINHSISGNFRFRYNPHEGTDLYIVINQGQNTDIERLDPHLPRINNQEVTVKFVKTFGL